MLILSILLMGITGGVLPYLPVYRTLDAQVMIMITIQIVLMMMRRWIALVNDDDDDGCCRQVGLVGFDSSSTDNFPWQTIVWVSVNICVSNGATFGSTIYLLK